MKSRIIAISAISAGFVAISLTIGAYVDMVDLLMLVIASVFVLLPLYYGSYKGCFLSFLAGETLALVFSIPKFNSIVFPAFFAFFGLYPVISQFEITKNVKPIIRHIIGAIWCILFCYGAYYYYTLLLGLSLGNFPQWLQFVANNILYFIGVFALIFYFIYDRYIIVAKRFIDRNLGRIIKK